MAVRKEGMKHFFAFITLAMVTACSTPFSPPAVTSGDLSLEEFFEGKSQAKGQYFSNSGKLKREFDVEIEGSWDGKVLTLVEDFTYDDGEIDQRIWRITKRGEGLWDGRADDVIGVAKGVERGAEFSWTYQVALPWKDREVPVTFVDKMWKTEETKVLNQAFIKKFGITLGKVIIEFEQQK